MNSKTRDNSKSDISVEENNNIPTNNYDTLPTKIEKKGSNTYNSNSVMNKSKQFDYTFKIVLIGDSGVGKSCILLRFADDQFNENFYATIGVDFRFKNLQVDGKNIRLQIVLKNLFYFKFILIFFFINKFFYDLTKNLVGHSWTGKIQNHHKRLL